MPKIEVRKDGLFQLIGRRLTRQELEELLPAAKAELDGEESSPAEVFKIELNDTNRPDLWSTPGLSRALRIYLGGDIPRYDFFSTSDQLREADERVIIVDKSIKEYRPYITSLCVTGKAITETDLLDIIQTQEKLCSNYGRKRKAIAMGVHRRKLITFPLHYRGADPETTRFVPLQMDRELSLREILTEHPKGRDYGRLVADFPVFPYLHDDKNETVSFPPVINSARIGGVKVGDEDLFVDLTGSDIEILMLAASIVACDLSDAGFTILPVRVEYPYDTPYGRTMATPYYFQAPAKAGIAYINRTLGVELKPEEAAAALERMGSPARVEGEGEAAEITIRVPEYRNDFLHPADMVEEVMIGRGMDSFAPEPPKDYTVGRLSPGEVLGRRVRDIFTGLGFQEMIYNYLGSRKDYIQKMNISDKGFIRVANPMSENYEYVRSSILPALLSSEAVSASGVYPHRIFEVGKVAFLDPDDVSGTATRNYLGFLCADRAADFNQISSFVSALFFYLSLDYQLEELNDPRFIAGRAAKILYRGRQAGIFGEVEPGALENWGIFMPCAAGELDLDNLLG
jgi:phenylalanyl-tRNA synthetase beta chain